MFCYNCGAQLSGGTKYCPECGAKQEYSNHITVSVEPTYEQPEYTPPKKRRKWLRWIVGIILCLVFICAALILFFVTNYPKDLYLFSKLDINVTESEWSKDNREAFEGLFNKSYLGKFTEADGFFIFDPLSGGLTSNQELIIAGEGLLNVDFFNSRKLCLLKTI